MTLFENDVSAKGIFITCECLSGRLRGRIALRLMIEFSPDWAKLSVVILPMVAQEKSTFEEGMFIVELLLSSRFVKWSGERLRAPRLRVLEERLRELFTRE